MRVPAVEELLHVALAVLQCEVGGCIVRQPQRQPALEELLRGAAGEEVGVVWIVFRHLEDVEEGPAPGEAGSSAALVEDLVELRRVVGVAGPGGHVTQHPSKAVGLLSRDAHIDIIVPRNKPTMPHMSQGGAPARRIVQLVPLAEPMEGVQQLQAALFFVQCHLRAVALVGIDTHSSSVLHIISQLTGP